MAKALPLVPVPASKLATVADLPKMRQFKATFPKRATGSAADTRKALTRWRGQQKAPPPPRNPDLAVKAVRPTVAQLTKLRAVLTSDVAPAEMLKQRMTADTFFGNVYSAVTTFEFIKMEAEFKRRMRSPTLRLKAPQEFKRVTEAAVKAFEAGGLRNANPAAFSKTLARNRANLNAITNLVNTASAGTAQTLDGRTKAIASFVPIAELIVDPSVVTTAIPGLCDGPIAEGSFTRHFSRSFSLTVRLRVWCPTWRNPFRTCLKTFTIAGVSFTLGLNVGYRVTCCGATAFGQAFAQACGTVVGITVCASCSATVAGVAGLTRTPTGSGCSYGLGLVATLRCQLFGQTVFQASAPFGWTVTGPCPPAGFCN